jgi:hypothetical protein
VQDEAPLHLQTTPFSTISKKRCLKRENDTKMSPASDLGSPDQGFPPECPEQRSCSCKNDAFARERRQDALPSSVSIFTSSCANPSRHDDRCAGQMPSPDRAPRTKIGLQPAADAQVVTTAARQPPPLPIGEEIAAHQIVVRHATTAPDMLPSPHVRAMPPWCPTHTTSKPKDGVLRRRSYAHGDKRAPPAADDGQASRSRAHCGGGGGRRESCGEGLAGGSSRVSLPSPHRGDKRGSYAE